RRFVLRRGRLHRAPDTPPALLGTSLLSPLGKLRLIQEPWRRPKTDDRDETVHEFAERRLGREVADRLVAPAVAGITAGDSRRLSLRAAFPQLLELEQRHGGLVRAPLPAPDAGLVTTGADADLAGALRGIPYGGLAVVALAYRRADLRRSLEGYGYLAVAEEGLDTLGVMWESSVFDGRAPEDCVLLRVMMGGSRRRETAGR